MFTTYIPRGAISDDVLYVRYVLQLLATLKEQMWFLFISSACKPRASETDMIYIAKLLSPNSKYVYIGPSSGAGNQQRHNHSQYARCIKCIVVLPNLAHLIIIGSRFFIERGVSLWYASPGIATWLSRSWPGILIVPVGMSTAVTSPPSTSEIVVTSGTALHVHGPTISKLTFSRVSTEFVYRKSQSMFIIGLVRQTSIYLIV